MFVVLGGAIIGLAIRYLLPHRDQHGAALVPALGAIFASVIWIALTWAGWKWDGTWIWVAALAGGGLITLFADLTISRNRNAKDAELLESLQRSIPV